MLSAETPTLVPDGDAIDHPSGDDMGESGLQFLVRHALVEAEARRAEAEAQRAEAEAQRAEAAEAREGALLAELARLRAERG